MTLPENRAGRAADQRIAKGELAGNGRRRPIPADLRRNHRQFITGVEA
jgi:hypothetical protein